MSDTPHYSDSALAEMMACPVCDALHRTPELSNGETARCCRCGTVLYQPRDGAMTQLLMLSATALVLLVAAIFFPFLELSSFGLDHRSSVFDAVLAFSEGPTLPLSLAVAALIIVLPLLRFALLAYVFAPMAIGTRPARQAARAFRWAEAMKPWAMAEIFIVGVAVALVKVAGLAKVSIGPAFWAFVGLLIIVVLSDTVMCRLTVWRTLARRRQ
jgi:paraquat-inducible protein A